MNFKNNSGITIVALIVTVIIIGIISGIVIYNGTDAIDTSKDDILKSELGMVQHAVLEQYMKYKTTNNEEDLLGVNVDETTKLKTIANELNIILLRDSGYYELDKDSIFVLGIEQSKNSYIINYSSGEVINITQKKTSSGESLYIKGNNF